MTQSAKRLDSIFEEQSQKKLHAAGEDTTEELPLIRFSIKDSVFAVGIDKVVEVTEMLQIVPYPESHSGHQGIVNLRGQIIPVLSFGNCPKTANENRLLVLEFTPGRRFCTPVSHPKKVSFAHEEGEAMQQIVSIDGMPARIIAEKDFPATRELGAEAGREE